MSLTQIIGKVFVPRQKALEKHQSGGEALECQFLQDSHRGLPSFLDPPAVT